MFIPLDILNFIISPFLMKEDIYHLKCVCKYLSEIWYTNVSLKTSMNLRYYQLKNLNILTITDTGYGDLQLFLDLTPLQFLVSFCLQADLCPSESDGELKRLSMCDKVELILPDNIENMMIYLGFESNLILRHFPKRLTKFDFTSQNGQIFHLPNLPRTLKMLSLTCLHGKGNSIPQWISKQELKF